MPKTSEMLFLNGKFMPLARGCVAIEDRGFQFGDGVYEMMRVQNGRPFRLLAHLQRLEESASGILLKPHYAIEEMQAICLELIRQSNLLEGTLYLQITRGVALRNHIPTQMQPTTLGYTRALQRISPEQWKRGAAAYLRPDDRWAHCNLKAISLLANVMAKMEAHRRGVDEAIFHSAENEVYECSTANIFCFIQGEVLTPPLSCKVLAGVTRIVAMEACKLLGLQCSEMRLKTDDLLRAQEVFLTSTTRNALPIRSIDGKRIGEGIPFFTHQIDKKIEEIIQQETSQPA